MDESLRMWPKKRFGNDDTSLVIDLFSFSAYGVSPAGWNVSAVFAGKLFLNQTFGK